MSKSTLFAVLMAILVSVCPATAQKPDAEKAKQVQKLREEIARTQTKLDALNKELAGLVPAKEAEPKVESLRHEFFKVGAIGTWKEGEYAHKVLEVIDNNSVYMAISYDPQVNVVVKGIPTKDVVDGVVIPLKGVWEFTGTTKHAGKTVFVIELHKSKR